jgi:protease IV
MKDFFRALGTLFRFLGKFVSILRNTFFNLLFLFVALVLIASFFTTKDVAFRDNSALVLSLAGDIVEERKIIDPISEILSDSAGIKDLPKETLLQDILDAIHSATTDNHIKCLLLDLENMGKAGINQLQVIGNALEEFKKSGKKVIAAEDFFTQKKYYLATFADTIILNPMGGVDLHGLGVYSLFFKDALDKLHVNYHVFRVGKYKSALEPITRNSMSLEAKNQNQQWLNSLWQTFTTDISKKRSLPVGTIDNYINNISRQLAETNGDTALLAKKCGLVDELKTRDEVREYLVQITASDPTTVFRQISLRDYLKTINHSYEANSKSSNTIGIIVAEGTILNGEQPPGAIGGDSLGEIIRNARTDNRIKAMVLRIDSGGGSVFASEVIRQELLAFKKSGKPYVVSMGAMAASGGYWIAAEANEIWASKTTLTGSIGIFGAIPTFEDTLDNIGIHHDGVGTTGLASGLNLTQPLPPSLAEAVQLSVERGYRQFLSIVANGRKIDPAALEEIAEGRVFDGKKAKELGLVDNLGTMQDAIIAAARIANISDYSTEFLHKPLSIKNKLLRQFSMKIVAFFKPSSAIGDSFSRLYHLLYPLHKVLLLNDPQGLYAHCMIDYN